MVYKTVQGGLSVQEDTDKWECTSLKDAKLNKNSEGNTQGHNFVLLAYKNKQTNKSVLVFALNGCRTAREKAECRKTKPVNSPESPHSEEG